jgi:hypothetical protein
MCVGSRVAPALVFFVGAFALGGCMTKKQAVSMRTGGEATPIVEVKPGYVERIALMDRYRLHDEMRHHMMHRPHVTVEELTDDEVNALPVEEETAEQQETPAAEPQPAR